jgi:hypothetical protein
MATVSDWWSQIFKIVNNIPVIHHRHVYFWNLNIVSRSLSPST